MSSRRDNEALLVLLAAARHGDDVALGQFVRSTQPIVHRFCVNFSSVDEADDLTQEVFIRAVRTLANYRAEGSVVSWLLSIARHVCADQVRRNQRRARLTARIRNERSAESMPVGNQHLTALIDDLDPDRKAAFVLTQILGLSYDEAAEACNCPVGTIRSRVARARADLMTAVRAAEAQ